jgi:integrase/recombinase XerD
MTVHQQAEIVTPTIVTVDRGTRRQAEVLAGAFVAGYSNVETQRSYLADLRLWFAFLEDADNVDPIHGVHRSHLELWMRMGEARGLKPATVNRRAGTVCSFFGWLVDEEILVKSPVRAARRPKVPKDSTREAMNRIELHQWTAAAKLEGGHPYVLACLLAYNGLRISEACGINVDDLATDSYLHVATILRKGGKRVRIALPPPTMQAIDRVLDGRTKGPLLLTKYGTRMNREAAARIVARFARQIGLQQHITPHSLRHSAITLLLSSGAPIRDVADFAGHEDLRTTSRYDRDRNNLERHLSTSAVQLIAGRA